MDNLNDGINGLPVSIIENGRLHHVELVRDYKLTDSMITSYVELQKLNLNKLIKTDGTTPAPGPNPDPVEKLTMVVSVPSTVYVGKTGVIKTNVTGKTVSFTSSNTSVATVTASGANATITGKAVGTVKVTIKADGYNDYTTSNITIKEEPTTKSNIYYGQVIATDTENELTVDQIASRVTPDYITSGNKYITTAEAAEMPTNMLNFMAVDHADNGDETYFNYMWFAYPKSFGTITEVRNESDAKETAWKVGGEVTVNGVIYTLMVYENALIMNNPMAYLFKV